MSMKCGSAPGFLHPARLVGDPVDVITGANTDLSLDFALPGALQLRWRRHYSSARNTIEGWLGWGHTHDYDRTLTHDLDGLRYTDPTGAVVPFQALGVGEEDVRAGFVLRRVNPETYQLSQPGEPLQDFEFRGDRESTPLSRIRQGGSQIRFRYTEGGRLCEIVDSRGKSIAVESSAERILGLYLIDGSEQRPLIVYEYDAAGNLVAGRTLHGAVGFRWDAHNRMTRRTDRREYSFHFEYDARGRCIHSRGDDGLFEVFLDYQPEIGTTLVRRGDGGQWTYRYDGSGNVTQIVDPYGAVRRFNLDEKGRIAEEIDPNGNATRQLYDHNGHRFASTDASGRAVAIDRENVVDPLAYQLPDTPLEWEHGRLLRKEQIRSWTPADPALQGFPEEVRALFEGRGRASIDSADGAKSTAPHDEDPPEEDEEGRPVQQGRPGHLRLWTYDPNGNLAEYQDPDGAVYRYRYQSWNALQQAIDPLGHVTLFGQSTQGKVNRVQDPGGTVTEYLYDLADRLIEIRSNGRTQERYGYDPAGNIVARIDGRGRTRVSWEIGSGNRDVVRRLASGETHSFGYDESGRIVAAATSEGAAAFAFSDEGFPIEDTRDGLGVVHRFAGEGLVSTTCLGRFRTSYRIEENGSLSITDPSGGVHRIAVSQGGMIARRLADGARELCAYDRAGRCRYKAVVRRGPGRPWTRTFSYSAAGDLRSTTDTLHGAVRYEHDAGHRISEEVLPDGSRRRFAFDAAGNLLAHPGLTDMRMAAENRLHSANGDLFSYDDRDHVEARTGPKGTTRYEYDDLGMLVRCEIDGEPWTAGYDAYGRRVRKTWRGRSTSYYWDDLRLAAELRHDGSVRIYVYADATALVPFLFVEYASRESAAESGRRYYIFTNQIGVPVRVEDRDGKRCWAARIDAYGRAEIHPESTLEMPLRFPGHYYDPETGLHHNRFRYYSPELGRYLQSDPAGQAGGINVYAYPVNPLVAVDIDGLGRGGQRTGKKGKSPPAGASAGCPLQALGPKPPRGTKEGQDWRFARYQAKGGKMSREEWDKRNKGGRGGGPNHAAIQRKLVEEGCEKERPIGDRAADAYRPPDPGPPPRKGEIHQIGGMNQRGDPIARERDAINDILNTPGYGSDTHDVYFHDKNKPGSPPKVNPQDDKDTWGG